MRHWKLERSGLLSQPEEQQIATIRKYFPQPGPEDTLLTRLYITGATNPSKTAQIQETELPIAEKLATQGQLTKATAGKYFLTEEGITIARGTLKIYPELKVST